MDTAYAFVVDLPRPLPEAVAALRTALQAEQLGIVSELDVAELAPGRSRIALQDPRVLALVSAQRAVRAACERDRAVIKRVADRLHALAGD